MEIFKHLKLLRKGSDINWKKLHMERIKNKRELYIIYWEELYKKIAKEWTTKQIILKTKIQTV